MTARVLTPGARLRKLRSMSVPEIAERVRYRAIVGVERWQHRRHRLAPADRLRRAVDGGAAPGWARALVHSRRGHRHRFLPGLADRAGMQRLFEGAYAGEREATLAHAADARRHRFFFFGRTFEYGDRIPWQADPVSGRAWPAVYHADVPVHGGDVGFGDVKYVWELNRQQCLVDLGKAWFLAGRTDDLAAVRRLVSSWIDANPYATGVNWSCALEPAFRVFSWLWAYYFTVADLDDEFHLAWLTAFHDHGRFIARHLEHYSSPYNHLMAEAAALSMLGDCFPEFRDAARWRRLARSVLAGRVAGQFYADGGSVEQSTFYHHATVGFLILAALTARAVHDELPGAVWSAIERGMDFSMKLLQPDGTTPAIGGADDGKPIRMEHLPFWDFRPYQAIGAVLFGRPDFKAAAGRFHEDAVWLLGPDGRTAFERLDSRPPHDTSVGLPASGYVVMRSDWSARADFVCFDCGEQAAGMRRDAVPNSMHGHADCLSIVAWLGGRPVLVDSGLYAYNCGGEWEAHFRETAAHNTARVDGRDQATHIRKMAWSHSYRATMHAWDAAGTVSWAVGSHDGYARGPAGVIHRRAVWLRPDGYLVVYDTFTGQGDHEIEVNYQFAPGRLERIGDDAALFDGFAELAWIGHGPWRARIACGGPGPQDGWIAPSLGVRQAAPRLSLTGALAGRSASLLTVVAARTADARRVTPAGAPGAARGTLLAVSIADGTDWVCAPDLAPDGPIDTDALVAVARVRDAGIDAFRLGGSHVRIAAPALDEIRTRPVTPGRAPR